MIRARDERWKGVDRAIMQSKRDMHEILFSITRHIRESPGGEVACCGCFTGEFVTLLSDNATPLSDAQQKVIARILKAVSGGARKVLRTAAEIQIGLAGINWRQTPITQYYKPTSKIIKPRLPKRDWTDAGPPPVGTLNIKNNKKYNSVAIEQNRNLTVDNVFSSFKNRDNVVYWEFRAG